MSPAGHTLCVLLSCPNPTLCVRERRLSDELRPTGAFGQTVKIAGRYGAAHDLERHPASATVPTVGGGHLPCEQLDRPHRVDLTLNYLIDKRRGRWYGGAANS